VLAVFSPNLMTSPLGTDVGKGRLFRVEFCALTPFPDISRTISTTLLIRCGHSDGARYVSNPAINDVDCSTGRPAVAAARSTEGLLPLRNYIGSGNSFHRGRVLASPGLRDPRSEAQQCCLSKLPRMRERLGFTRRGHPARRPRKGEAP
jgi:hypothetical protein